MSTQRNTRRAAGAAVAGAAFVVISALPAAAAEPEPNDSTEWVGAALTQEVTEQVIGINKDAAGLGLAMTVPVANFTLSSRFNESGGNWSSGRHTGIDLVVPTGTQVVAAIDGVVTDAGESGAYGNAITIKSADGIKTMYAHLNKVLVKKGQAVTAGQLIGKSGATGNVTGPHLHLEVIKNGVQVNPEPYLFGTARYVVPRRGSKALS